MGHPIIGDPVYGPRKKRSNWAKRDLAFYQAVKAADRQMLHAFRLGFVHPVTAENLHFDAPLPEDMIAVIKALKKIS
jgi:23S rRNA pseudouridine1911/1915/1917 synthase